MDAKVVERRELEEDDVLETEPTLSLIDGTVVRKLLLLENI
jgi:hypothetical protein